jgi:hypothetical protein
MPYSIKISEDNTFIIVKVEGQINSRSTMEFSIAAHRMGRERGIKLLLIDLTDSRNDQSVDENYDLISQDIDESQEIDRRVRVALYVSPDDHSHDFGESVARSNGHNVRLFRKLEDAMTFLKV